MRYCRAALCQRSTFVDRCHGARSSAGEHPVYTRAVGGSKPSAPTHSVLSLVRLRRRSATAWRAPRRPALAAMHSEVGIGPQLRKSSDKSQCGGEVLDLVKRRRRVVTGLSLHRTSAHSPRRGGQFSVRSMSIENPAEPWTGRDNWPI